MNFIYIFLVILIIFSVGLGIYISYLDKKESNSDKLKIDDFSIETKDMDEVILDTSIPVIQKEEEKSIEFKKNSTEIVERFIARKNKEPYRYPTNTFSRKDFSVTEDDEII